MLALCLIGDILLRRQLVQADNTLICYLLLLQLNRGGVIVNLHKVAPVVQQEVRRGNVRASIEVDHFFVALPPVLTLHLHLPSLDLVTIVCGLHLVLTDQDA